MTRVRAIIVGFLLICFFVYIFMLSSYHAFDEDDDSVKNQISQRPLVKPYLRILTATPKRRSQPVTVAANRANFIMMEARQISDHFGLVFWTLINSAYLELTRNWLCQTEAMAGIHTRVFIITMDEDTATKIRSQWPLISVLSLRSTSFNSSLIWGQDQYTDFLVLRASIIRLFVDNDVRFVLFETDSVWLRNPHEYFESYTSADIVLPKKYRADVRGRDLTFDPMIVVPNRRTKSFFAELYQRLISPKYHANGTLYDQDVLDDMCTIRFAYVRCATFPWAEIADGFWFKLDERKRANLGTYIVNNNFYSGIANKISRQALNDFWYLTVDHRCNNATLKKRNLHSLTLTY